MQPSSPMRHAVELVNCIKSSFFSSPPILFLYTDGGPDHRVTYLSVQLSLICVFQTLDLDFLCVARTAPHNSWRNPVERMMSILNIGLQGVGLMRKEMGQRTESELSKCNSEAQVRAATEKMPELYSHRDQRFNWACKNTPFRCD